MSHIQKHEEGFQAKREDQGLVGEQDPAPQEVGSPEEMPAGSSQEASSSSGATQATMSSKPSEASCGQVKQGQSTSPFSLHSDSLINTQLEKKMLDLVKFLSDKYITKEPITEAEIMNNVIKGYESFYPLIFKSACECMEAVFGIGMKEADDVKRSYVPFKILDLSYDGRLSNEQGLPKTGLLVLILAVIFMEGNRAPEKKIWEVLSIIGVYPDKHDFICGNPRKLVTEDLVMEQYLEYKPIPGSDPPCYEFLWGPRAYAETTKMKVLQFFSKVSGSSPTAFTALYREALKEEEERARAAAANTAGPTGKGSASSGDKPRSLSK
ncbi:putative MAGE domain-containing protein MAGEA13P [Nannospalax galili]|uniref:putative MAGE domain-containing protein MAGEA13P n=1 Tax=Nannospalax galili TaxID=1026970 RepID=UPI0004ED6299|nr:putative MAGE domain-containing protein MAGEA13P [Nannospalax galili]